jgi:hypothetical protein
MVSKTVDGAEADAVGNSRRMHGSDVSKRWTGAEARGVRRASNAWVNKKTAAPLMTAICHPNDDDHRSSKTRHTSTSRAASLAKSATCLLCCRCLLSSSVNVATNIALAVCPLHNKIKPHHHSTPTDNNAMVIARDKRTALAAPSTNTSDQSWYCPPRSGLRLAFWPVVVLLGATTTTQW